MRVEGQALQLTPPSPLFSLRAPRTAASCNLGPARQRWGWRPPASSSPLAHPLPARHGMGVEVKEKYPFGFFSSVFFFLREVIFYSDFILKEKHKQKKKKHLSQGTLPLPASVKLHICLKNQRGLLPGAKGQGCFCRAEFLLFCPACCLPPTPAPRDPKNMVPERQVWSLFKPASKGEGLSQVPGPPHRSSARG